MRRVLTALLFCAAAQAATLNVTLTVNATISLAGAATGSYAATGTATLTGGITDSGTFNASIPTADLTSTSATVPYTLTLKSGTMGGNLTLPITAILGSGTGAAPATVTSATGSYSGDTGSFNLSGTGGIGATGITATFTGSGTITTGGTPVAPPPVITAVLDAGTYSPNIAQGSIFVVKGTNLSASGYVSLAYPLPTSSGGTSISFMPAGGGTPTAAYLIYTYLLNGVNQLAAVLPSTLAAGNYNVTVTYNGTASVAFPAQVVAVKPGILTQDSTGSGLAVAQNIISATEYDLNRLTTGTVAGVTISPGKPGETLVVYATGLGPVPGGAGDNTASPGYDFTKNGVNVQVLVGGTAIPALYAGRAPGFSGLDQIDFTLPANIATGCTVTLQVMVGNVTSAATTLSIAPSASPSACVLQGFTTAQLAALDGGGTYSTGNFDIEQISETVPGTGVVKNDEAEGTFSQVTGFELGSVSAFAFSQTTIGSCTVTQSSSGSSSVAAGGGATYLDAGAVTLTGPSGSSLSNTALTELSNTYSLSIGEEGVTIPGSLNGKIVAGTYTLAGKGGKDVGAFNVAITLGTPLTVTGGLPSAITESAGWTVNWTGGNASDVVQIVGSSGSTTGTGANLVTTSTGFYCTTTAGAGTFTVPAAVLTLLPKAPPASGFLDVLSTPVPVSFTAPLTAGGTLNATFSALVGVAGSVTYQ